MFLHPHTWYSFFILSRLSHYPGIQAKDSIYPEYTLILSPGFTLLQIPQSLCQSQVHFIFFSPEFPPIGSPHTIISHQNWLTSLLIHLTDSILFYAYLNHSLVFSHALLEGLPIST